MQWCKSDLPVWKCTPITTIKTINHWLRHNLKLRANTSSSSSESARESAVGGMEAADVTSWPVTLCTWKTTPHLSSSSFLSLLHLLSPSASVTRQLAFPPSLCFFSFFLFVTPPVPHKLNLPPSLARCRVYTLSIWPGNIYSEINAVWICKL